MKKIWFGVLVGVPTLSAWLFAQMPSARLAIAQTTASNELYYLSFGRKVPLKLRQDVIVAADLTQSHIVVFANAATIR